MTSTRCSYAKLNEFIFFLNFFFSPFRDIEDITQEEVDRFGVSFIFKRALRRLDVQTEQRRLQQVKFDGHLMQLENDYKTLELRLKNRDRDFDKLNDKYVNIQVCHYANALHKLEKIYEERKRSKRCLFFFFRNNWLH